MEDSAINNQREEFFSRVVRAGKRTYFFDVKQTRGKEMYLTVTESKRLFDNATGKFYYEKHKIFLYKEDFEKFANGLNAVIEFIETGKAPDPDPSEDIDDSVREKNLHDLTIDDLDEDERLK